MSIIGNPVVSIIMPAFNSVDTIAPSIISVINQTYNNWELIVIDDDSSDDTIKLISKFNDPRIYLYKNTINLGVSASRNIGLSHAKGAYIAFLDSDDIWLPSKLELQVLFSISTNSAITYCKYEKVDARGFKIGMINPLPEIYFSNMLFKNHIALSTGMYSKNIFPSAKFKNVRHEDYVFWASLMSGGSIARLVNSESPLMVYRVSKNSLSGNKFKSALWHWINLRDDFGCSFLSACYYFIYYALSKLLKLE